jgi:hypothetical protein
MVQSSYSLITIFDQLSKIGGLLKIFGYFFVLLGYFYRKCFWRDLTNDYNQQTNNSTND